MRIVFINPIGEVGGAERSLLAWIKAVRQAYPQASLHLITPAEGSLADRARELGVAIAVVPMPQAIARLGGSTLRGSRLAGAGRLLAGMAIALPGAMAYVLRARAALRRLKPDLIHSNGLKCHLLLRLITPTGVPVVWHIHDFIGHRPRMAGGLRWASAVTAAGVAVSQAVATDARTVLPKTLLHVVYNVTDLRQFSPVEEAERNVETGRRTDTETVETERGAILDQLAGLKPGDAGVVRVILVATYARWKGQDVFLESAARATGGMRTTPMRFYIVGGPIYRTGGSQFTEAELRAKAAGLGVEEKVGFIGFQNDPADIYRAADVVVHASTQPEPFGLTVIEAMACRRATIAVNAGGSAELFTDGEDALGIPPNDPSALAEAILKLAGSEELRSRLGAAARESVVRRFNPDNLPNQVKIVYGTLNGGHSDRET